MASNALVVAFSCKFLVLVLLLGNGTCEGEVKCRFGGAEYEVGQVWHPRLETQGTVFCVTCQCYQGGRMNCSSRECPVTCSNGEDSSECCRICAESRTPQRPAAPEVVACIHNGKIYKDGQSFPSNSTGMKVHGPNQCVQCKCQDGLVLCEVQTCPHLECLEPVTLPDNCCPQCPAEVGSNDMSSPVTFKDPTAPKDRRDKDCISAGKYYLDGSTWHPVIGPFGPMDCVMCQCNSGNIECNRFKCPSRSELSCSKPVKQFGLCCPVCPATEIAVQQGDLPESGSLQCVPKATELVAYRAQGAGNLSEFLQYAFQQPGAKNAAEAELHTWVMRSGAVHSFQIQTITASDFVDLRHKFRFVPLGTTLQRHVSKFGRREKKLRRRCKTSCSSKVQRLEDALSLAKIAMRKTCLANEIQLPPV